MNGKRKGGQFEREICVALSLWVSDGVHRDLFWRSAMSGGRATVARQHGGSIRQSGDVCAVAEEGYAFAHKWYVEAKFYRDVGLLSFFTAGTGKLAGWWRKAETEAAKYNKQPMLIARQNRIPTLMLLPTDYVSMPINLVAVRMNHIKCVVFLFDEITRLKYASFSRPPNRRLASQSQPARRLPVRRGEPDARYYPPAKD